MSYKQRLRAEITAGLDETYVHEPWAEDFPGKAYFDVHLSTIEEHETATPIFKEFLAPGGLKILESGCGTGRWMAYFERLGNRSFGIDDSGGPLRAAREHDPDMNLVRANALATPFHDNSFDAAFSSYVAEHFEDGPGLLFREIHRVLKPGGLFFVVVPYNNWFRRLVVNPIVSLLCGILILCRRRLAFTEYRYTQAEMDGFVSRAGFEVLRTVPDDYKLPWSKGLFCDLCDVASFFYYEPRPLYEFRLLGRTVAALLQRISPWLACGGIFYVCRARK
jgi:ubiquinone/menaquinone biosynthesis C-methylase UbiE